ncbi:phage portal protein [Clostridium sp. NSJ-49]|uniref:phage portal protein n=1 Tax=Clostridium sp. NSJ-49 TaxID=2763034 RepID=UPI00164CC1C1|nr:phage portal protein [Clostridium sp. NSJ-49]
MVKINFIEFVKDFLNPKTKIGGKNIVEDIDIDLSNIKSQIYFKELALYTAISYIANAISKCEIKTFVKGKEVKEEEYFVLNYSANLNENSSLFWHKVIEKIFYSSKGEALVIVGRDKKLYCADDYTVDELPMLGNRYRNIRIGTLSLDRSYRIDEVFLFRLENMQVKKIIDGLHENYSEFLTCAIKNYKKSNSNKYKLNLDEVEAGDEKFNKIFETIIKEQLKSFIESEFSIYPEYSGQKLEDITPKNSSKDASDILSIKKDIFETTAQAIKIPQSLMLGNITNMKEVMNTFITNVIDPYAKMIERELTRKEGYQSWKEGNYAKVDTSKINHIDILEVAEKLDKLISSGTTCIDETRALIDMEALNTDFSKTHFITKNYDTIENRLKGGEKNE